MPLTTQKPSPSLFIATVISLSISNVFLNGEIDEKVSIEHRRGVGSMHFVKSLIDFNS